VDSRLVAKQQLFEAMMEVPWLPNHGIPGGYTANCMFAELCEVVLGQEQVDEVITRDIHRWAGAAGAAGRSILHCCILLAQAGTSVHT
jgi:hypothetical protein